MTRKRRTQDELRKASDHLHYEIWMLISVAQGLASGITGESVINNSLLESFAIHARVLLDFLYAKEKPPADDVVAEDFLATPQQWHEARPPKSQTLQMVHRRVAKEVAHLTYARQDVTPEMKGWPFIDIAKEIQIVINEFLRIVPEYLLGPRWDAYKKERSENEVV